MNLFYNVYESLWSRTVRGAELRGIFGCLIFNNYRRIFSKIPLDSAWKYATRYRNEGAKRKINHFTGIQNIKLNKMLFVTYSTLFGKHDKL